MQETQEMRVWSLGWEYPLEEGMANHSSIFAWRIPWTGEPGRLQSIGSQRIRHNWSDWACSHTGYLGFLFVYPYSSEKVGLKLNIQKTKIMVSGPIISWEIDGETVKTVSDFIFLGSKITSDGDCSHEIKRRLLLGRKVMTNLDSILKSRDITLPTKVLLESRLWFFQ